MPAYASGTLVRTQPYVVSSSEGAIYAGDVCTLTSLGTVKAVAGAFASTMIGVAANSLAANNGSTAATINLNSSQMLWVYDDPDQVFVGSCTTSGIINSLSLMKNVVVLATGAIGSTGPHGVLLRSVMAVSGVSGSSAGVFKFVGLHPIEQGDYSTDAGSAGAAASVRKVMVKPNIHFLAPGASGTVVTT